MYTYTFLTVSTPIALRVCSKTGSIVAGIGLRFSDVTCADVMKVPTLIEPTVIAIPQLFYARNSDPT